ncbi:hypothetical protein L596_004037 [Steinernema carpocapsae]|uniref:Uncharacterized protein n=1 Tax=Steinernema carpocapsae TaxID=34508 RepID=A0A4U8UW24_STECR|nr:hypothetical protein L596_004037 [Steinernema carpocapsae]
MSKVLVMENNKPEEKTVLPTSRFQRIPTMVSKCIIHVACLIFAFWGTFQVVACFLNRVSIDCFAQSRALLPADDSVFGRTARIVQNVGNSLPLLLRAFLYSSGTASENARVALFFKHRPAGVARMTSSRNMCCDAHESGQAAAWHHAL